MSRKNNKFKSGLTEELYRKLRKEVDDIFESGTRSGISKEQMYECITPMLCRTLTDEERKERAKILKKKWAATPQARAKALTYLEQYWTKRVLAKIAEENK